MYVDAVVISVSSPVTLKLDKLKDIQLHFNYEILLDSLLFMQK